MGGRMALPPTPGSPVSLVVRPPGPSPPMPLTIHQGDVPGFLLCGLLREVPEHGHVGAHGLVQNVARHERLNTDLSRRSRQITRRRGERLEDSSMYNRNTILIGMHLKKKGVVDTYLPTIYSFIGLSCGSKGREAASRSPARARALRSSTAGGQQTYFTKKDGHLGRHVNR